MVTAEMIARKRRSRSQMATGFRGAPVCDAAALENTLLRVSAMVEDIPQIAELDLNPFVVHSQGAEILDARVRVTAVQPRPLLGVRGCVYFNVTLHPLQLNQAD
jgi:hypothetical protein